MGIRTSFVRYRPGDAETVTISPAWLSVTGGTARGGPQVFTRGDLPVPVVAWIRCKQDWDVLAGDVLRCASGKSAGRLFVVRQISPEQETQLLACGELSSIIPDEFEASVIEAWWSADSGSFSLIPGGGALVVPLPISVFDSPLDVSSLSQQIKGNFDVWAEISVPTGHVTEDVYLAWVGFRTEATGVVGVKGVFAGVRWGQNKLAAIRYDADGVSSELMTANPITVVDSIPVYVRLRRRGSNLLVYYASGTLPRSEEDWTLIVPETAVSSDAPGWITLGGSRLEEEATATVEFVRNWDL